MGTYSVYRLYPFARSPDMAVEEVGEEDREAAVGYVRDVVSSTASLMDSLGAEGLCRDEPSVLADLIVLALKAPFFADPVEVAEFKQLSYISPFNYMLAAHLLSLFKKYSGSSNIVNRYVEEVNAREPWDELVKFLGSRELEGYLLLLKKSVEEDSRYWAFFKIPQDTRPGLNTGLVTHMLLTSALAWALLYEKGDELKVSREEAGREGVLRLAAVLHDLGKLKTPRGHVEEGISLLEEINLELQSPGLSKAIGLVKRHHRPEAPLSTILSVADRAASNIDRVSHLAIELIGDDIRSEGASPEKIYVEGDWRESEKIHSKLGELSRRFYERVMGYALAGGKLLDEGDVYYLLVDLGGIQALVRRGGTLHTMVGASYFIDMLTTSLIPLNLMRLGVPPEAILVSSGGIVAAVIPRKLLSKAEEVLVGIGKRLGPILRLKIYKAPLLKVNLSANRVNIEVSEIPAVLEKLALDKLLDKMLLGEEAGVVDLGLRFENGKAVVPRLCEICGLEPANIVINKRFEGEIRVCEVCRTLLKIGRERVFKAKYSSEVVVGDEELCLSKAILEGANWGEVGPHIMEFVAGHRLARDGHGVKPVEGLGMNYAVLSGDGDKMGELLSRAWSLSYLYELSLTVDLSLKRGLRRLLRITAEAMGLGDVARLLMGYMYSGGDDFVLFTPAYLAPLAAVVLSEEFEKATRGSTLSIGIASAKAQHPVWQLVDAARYLEDLCKRRVDSQGSRESRVAYCYVDTGLLNRLTAETFIDQVNSDKVSVQPLTRRELVKLMETLTGVSGLEMVMRSINASLGEARNRKTVGVLRRAKNVVMAFRKAWSAVEQRFTGLGRCSPEAAVRLAWAYLGRQSRRLGGESRKYYEVAEKIVREYLSRGLYRVPVADVYMLYKLMGGGLA